MGHTQAPPQNLYVELLQLGALTSSTANEQVYGEKKSANEVYRTKWDAQLCPLKAYRESTSTASTQEKQNVWEDFQSLGHDCLYYYNVRMVSVI